MKISERCKKQIEDMEKLANELKMTNKFEPYQVVAWDRDFESISELYLAYKDTISEKIALQADFEESEDRCATLEAENNSLRNTIKNMKENFTEHLNALEAENHNLKKQIEDVKKQTYDMYSHKLVKLQFLEAENQILKEQVIDGLNKECNKLETENEKLKHDIEELKCCNNNQGRTIDMLRETNDSQFNQIKAYKDKLFTKDEEIRKLYEKVGELHTIKKSFEVLRALYLGDYENDEPF